MKNWTNLHNHTVYSMLDGHGDIEQYLNRAKSLGMSGIATTDHGNIHSWLDFYDAGTAVGVKPILGSELYQARKTRFDKDEEERSGPAKNEWEQRGPYHLTAIAKNNIGYHNLIKLSSMSYLEGYYVKPRVDHDLISQYSEGLIILSGCLNGEVAQALLRGDYNYALKSAAKMQEIVGKDNYFIEVHDHGLSEQKKIMNQLVQIAETIGAPVVPSGDCHYVHKEDARAHDIMLCVSTNANIHTENRFSFHGDNFYLKSYSEMEAIFPEDWLDNSMKVCDMIDVNLSFGEIYFPDFPIPQGETSVEYFERLAWEGLKKRYGDPLPSEIITRAEHEIKVVKDMGFPEYFLVVSDLVKWSKENDIRVGWGRGSAAGSVLSYAFEITNLDPIKFGLMFERFLVEGRKSMPDIDLDFDDRYRDRVIDYARNKYGDDKVAHICTFNKTGARQSLRDAARALGYSFSEGDSIAKKVPPPVLGVSKSLSECMSVQDFISEYNKNPISKEIVDTAFGLEGIVRQTGMHAAGIVISRDSLTEYLPVMQKGADNPVITQWDMGRVEQCGILKIDFLGLRNLGVIDSCIKLVEKNRGIKIDVDSIPIDDKKTFDELCKGNCIGVFQLESSSMREMMVSLQPRSIEDVMALISLHRPGPMGSGMDREYIDRKHGRSKVSYEHPKLKEVLEPSLGIMLYQEDVLGVARELAGFTSAEADDLRKVIGKKLMDKIPLMRSKFVEGCKTFSDLSETKSNKIFSDIEYFGGYGFNRAHAASYAMVSYITAYLKSNYTVEYMAALMSSVVGNKDKQSLYLSDCRKLGINVIAPSVNRSKIDFEVVDESTIIFGLSAVNGIGSSIAEAIVGCQDLSRPFVNIFDFFRRCDPVILKKSTLEHLVRSGAFDELYEDDQESVNRLSELDVLESEKTELGMYITDHPVYGIWDTLRPKVDCEIIDVSEYPVGSNLRIGGMITDFKTIMTKKNQKMYKLVLEDISSDIEIIIFPRDAAKIDEKSLRKGSIHVFFGSITKDGDEEASAIKMFYSGSEQLDSSLFNSGKSIVIKVSEEISVKTIDKICDIINSSKGDRPVYLQYESLDKVVNYKFNTNVSSKMEQVLRDIVSLES